MLNQTLRDIAEQNGLTIASGTAYGMLNGCYVTLTGSKEYQRISIYVGPQEAPAPGYVESQTVSCARQIIQTISVASGEENIFCLMTGNEAIPALVLNHAGSVVTVNFPEAPEASAGVTRFVCELLPSIAPLTRPQQCIFCAQPTGGEGCPVRLSGDTVVPMHDECLERAAANHRSANKQPGSVGKGVLGAILGALIGAVIWALMYRLGYFARIVCLLIGLLSSWGYDLLKGRPGRTKIVTVAACSLLAMGVGSLVGSVLPFLEKYASLGELSRQMIDDVSSITPAWLTYVKGSIANQQLFWADLGMNLLLGALFTGVGWLDFMRQSSSANADASRPRRLRGKA